LFCLKKYLRLPGKKKYPELIINFLTP
jgi:hypothetical protein